MRLRRFFVPRHKNQHRQSRCCFLVTRRGHLGPKSRRKRRLGLEIWHLRMPISPLRGSRPRSIKIRTQRMLCPYFGDPPGTRTPDLRLKRAASIVIQRFVTCEKVAILAGFLHFAFYSVLQNNSTFCNGVEFLLNYFSVYFRDKYSPASRACARVFYASTFFLFLTL